MGGGAMDGFAEYVEVETPRLLGLGYALTGNPHDAWDLTQEALTRVGLRWRRLADENPGGYARTTLVRGGGCPATVQRMSRRRSSRATEVPDDSVNARLGRLLSDARAEIGFLIWAEEEKALRANPPADLELPTDAVIAAGGYDPTHVSGDTRRAVRALIDKRMGQDER